MIILPPVLSEGKTSEEAVGDFILGSVDITAVAGAFPVDTHVWTAKLDGTYTQVEYRGKVTVVDGTTRTVEQPALAAISGSKARLWKATAQKAFALTQGSPIRGSFKLGKTVRMSAGGVPYPTARRVTSEHFFLGWPKGLMTDYKEARVFIRDTVAAGVEPFTVSWHDFAGATPRVCVVVLLDPEFNYTSMAVLEAAFAMEFIVQTDAAYL